ncbi:hypothetical protein ACFV3E_35545 [Streptomyces sp. NPDC059718]
MEGLQQVLGEGAGESGAAGVDCGGDQGCGAWVAGVPGVLPGIEEFRAGSQVFGQAVFIYVVECVGDALVPGAGAGPVPFGGCQGPPKPQLGCLFKDVSGFGHACSVGVRGVGVAGHLNRADGGEHDAVVAVPADETSDIGAGQAVGTEKSLGVVQPQHAAWQPHGALDGIGQHRLAFRGDESVIGERSPHRLVGGPGLPGHRLPDE